MSDDDPEHQENELLPVLLPDDKQYHKSTFYMSDGNFLSPEYIRDLLKSRGAVETYSDGDKCFLDLNPSGIRVTAEVSNIYMKDVHKGFREYLRVSLKGTEDPTDEIRETIIDFRKNPLIETYRGLFPALKPSAYK